MKILTIDEVARQLLDGLDNTDFDNIKQWLLEYQLANQLSLNELNELCWENSTWIFEQIYG